MKKLILIVVVLLQVIIVNTSKAQIDPHFSQYYANPLWLNPALTGVIDGDARVNANFKNQWSSISNAYQTGAISADFNPNDKVGIGFNMLDQQAGSVGYNYFTFYGSFSYGVSLSDDAYQQLRFGLQAGMINRSFDESKLQLDNQYNPLTGFDPTMPGNENFSTTGATVFDAGAGIYYFYGDPDSKANLFGGLSVGHLSQPKDPFATQGINSTLPMRFTVHGGVRLQASDFLDITPHLIYIRQGNAQEKDIGVYAEFKSDNQSGFIVGGMYRFNDAAVADVGYHISYFTLGLSYDVNTSGLNAVSHSQGGPELSLSYVFHKHTQNRDVVCPRF